MAQYEYGILELIDVYSLYLVVYSSQSVITPKGHTQAVTCVRWGGKGLIFSAGRDRLVNVFNDKGQLVRSLKGHAHWVNTMSLSTEFCLRTGAYDHNFEEPSSTEQGIIFLVLYLNN